MNKLAQRAQKLFIQYLRENNLKVTQERLALLDEIFCTNEHLDADELLARMKTKQRKVSRATVYRTLDLLVEEGLACRNDLGAGQEYFTNNRHGPHIHLVCRFCGKITDADYPLIAPMKEHFQVKYGFAADLEHLSIFGVCATCQTDHTSES